MTRVLRALPNEKKVARARLIAQLRDLLDGCLAYQRSDGLFYNIVDRPDTFVETNLGQMLAYSIYEGVRGGWLPVRYLPFAERARNAAGKKVDHDGLVQGVAGAPDFNHPGFSPEGQAFYLMMEAARHKWRQKRAN